MARGNRTHGLTHSKEWKTWSGIKRRCISPRALEWKYYGSKGIKVCDRWLNSFENFFADMGPQPDGTSIDRIDGNRNYEPGNCRWATAKEQARNRYDNHRHAAFGRNLLVSEWAELTGISLSIFRHAVERGGSVEKVLKRDPRFATATPQAVGT